MVKAVKIKPIAKSGQKAGGQITQEMNISEVAQKYPKTLPVFFELGIYCFGCAGASFETIKDMAKIHGLDLKKLLDKLNKAANKNG